MIAALVVSALLLVIGGGTGAGYLIIRNQAQQLQDQLTKEVRLGQSDLEAAKTSLSQANVSHDPKLIPVAKEHFMAAKADFQAAIHLADGSQLLHEIEQLPGVGPTARSKHMAVDGIAGMGLAISNAGFDLSELVGRMIQPPASGSQQGRTLLNILQDTSSSIATIRGELAKADATAATVDVHVLPADQAKTFAKARATIGAALASIDEFESLVPVLTELLGGNGQRNYLIEQVNPAELRPGGGFIGTYSVLRADHGTLTLLRSGSSTDLAYPRPLIGQPGYVAPPGPMKQLVVFDKSWSFFDSNFFPDFPSNALAGERFAQPRLGMHIDGVVSIDYYTVAKMLELTGAVRVPGYSLSLNSANFVSTVVSYDLSAITSPEADAEHKAILSAVAGPLMGRLTSLPPASWPAVVVALNDLVSQRHLQVYFNNATVQSQFNKFGWSGVLNQAAGSDFMMEIESNLGGTKANYFVTRHYALSLTKAGDVLHHRLTVDLTNAMPYDYRPHDFYRVYAMLLVAKGSAMSDNLTPLIYRNGPPPAGTTRIDGWTLIPGYGNRAQAVFTWDTAWAPAPDSQVSIYWQKEPGTVVDRIDVTWNASGGKTFKVAGDLGQDRIITLLPGGVTMTPGHLAQATLPSLNLG